MTTLREHLQRLVSRNVCIDAKEECRKEEPACDCCENRWDAVSALEILEDAERLSLYYGSPEAHTWAVVPDPGPSEPILRTPPAGTALFAPITEMVDEITGETLRIRHAP